MASIKIEKVEKEDYEKFLEEIRPISFLQNYEWGEVEKELGKEVFRFGIYDGNSLIGIVQLIGNKAKRGDFLLIPHGPIIKKEYHQNLKDIILKIIEKIKEEKLNKRYIFLRLNSGFLKKEINIEDFKKIKFNLAPIWSVSENFFVKRIDKDEEMLLKEMSSNHRKLVLDSLKKEFLEIEESEDLEKLDIFLKIYKDLSQRKKFTPYPDELIKKEFEIFSKLGKAKLYLGKVENKYYCGALIIFSYDTACYHHGASLPLKEPLNYKLHWKIMIDAKNMGYKLYNMWGITLSEDKNHPWYGLTQFKKGFGGEIIELLPTLDYKFSSLYYLTYLYEKLIRFKKRL